MKQLKTDVLIIGAGLAGIVTALELIKKNKKVILIDADVKEKLGGLARWSFGGMFFVNTPHQKRTGIKDSVDLALQDWHSFAEFGNDDYWPKKWAELYVNTCTDEVYTWLKEHGVGFFPVVHWVERGLLKPGNSVPRFHMVWGTGQWLVDCLVNHLHKLNQNGQLQILFQHKASELILENEEIKGVQGICLSDESEFEILAENTVVATGGITGNIEKVKQHWYKPWGAPPEVILNGSHPVADGHMHDQVSNIGGNITHLDKAWHYAAGIHHPKPKFEGHGLSIVPPRSALWLNYKGERFGPMPLVSSYDTRYLVEQICKEEKKYSWQVLNLKILMKEFAVSGAEGNEAIRDKKIFDFLKTILFGNKKLVNWMLNECPDFIVAHSVEELVEKMNTLTNSHDVDVRLLKQSIQGYDDTIDRGVKLHNDEQLRRITHLRQYTGDKARICKYQKINDSKALPLIAIREFILSRKSLGGIQTNLQSKVLKTNSATHDTIKGLYAVGEAAGFGGGGMHGLRSLEGTFLGGCILTAKIAAKEICS